jgi:hypothetical protein
LRSASDGLHATRSMATEAIVAAWMEGRRFIRVMIAQARNVRNGWKADARAGPLSGAARRSFCCPR